ncbi:MAG: MoaD/ThiS family protein [Myxococcota bacterium]|jgi:sulfur-carrier protein|nr:MoaD/ThiS family protein [Myxococcota bacterium]
MARVILPQALADRFGGEVQLEIEGRNVRALLAALDARYPGLGQELEGKVAVAIDGEIHNDPLLEPVEEQSEVHFLPRLAGG